MIYSRCVFLSACLTLLSAHVLADVEQVEEDWQEEGLTPDGEIADASMYPVIAEPCHIPMEQPEKMHHYVLYGEMLYLKPYMGGMPWTYVQDKSKNLNPNDSSTTSEHISEHIKNINLDFDFGFRVGIGFNSTWMKMENQLTWMRLHTQTSHSLPKLTNLVGTSSSTNYGQPKAYVPFWFDLTSANPPGQEFIAKETTRLEWDQIDWVFKIPLSPYKRLTFLPLLGLRGLISEIKSHQTQYFNAEGETASTTMPVNNMVTDLKERLNAIGLVTGIDGDVNFGWGFHLSALLDASVVYGNVKRRNNTAVNVPVIPGTLVPQEINAFDSSYKFKPIFDALATLSWNWDFCRSKFTVNAHIGYEAHYMPRFLEFIRVIDAGDTPYYYDLMFQGLNAGLGLSF